LAVPFLLLRGGRRGLNAEGAEFGALRSLRRIGTGARKVKFLVRLELRSFSYLR